MSIQKKLISVFIFLIIWQGLAVIVKSELLPSFLDVFLSMIHHIKDDELLKHLSITLYRVLIAFVISMFLGVCIGILMGVYKHINELFDYILVIFLNIPALVVFILSYIWLGLSDFAAILAVVINKVPVIIVTIREGARMANTSYKDLAIIYQIPKKDYFKQIFLPQIYPYIMASTRLSLSLIWKIVLLVELLGRNDGIGFQLANFFQFFDIESVLAYSMAFILVILFIENTILRSLDKKISKGR